MSTLQVIAQDFAKGFDEIRVELLGRDAKLVLIKQDGSPYSELKTVVQGWCAKFSEHFGAITFNIADISQDFGLLVLSATHLYIIDSALPSTNNLLHEVTSDTAAPSADSPFWRVRARSTGRLYEKPAEE